jgi:hypothetical protein
MSDATGTVMNSKTCTAVGPKPDTSKKTKEQEVKKKSLSFTPSTTKTGDQHTIGSVQKAILIRDTKTQS